MVSRERALDNSARRVSEERRNGAAGLTNLRPVLAIVYRYDLALSERRPHVDGPGLGARPVPSGDNYNVPVGEAWHCPVRSGARVAVALLKQHSELDKVAGVVDALHCGNEVWQHRPLAEQWEEDCQCRKVIIGKRRDLGDRRHGEVQQCGGAQRCGKDEQRGHDVRCPREEQRECCQRWDGKGGPCGEPNAPGAPLRGQAPARP
jgi:hypothetical protein